MRNNFLPVAGIHLGTAQAAIRYPDRRDVVVIELAAGSQCVGVFTQNAFCAAPVQVAKQHLAQASPRYLVINTGNANAGTGQSGIEDAVRSCAVIAELQGCEIQQVLPFSTGVIGERLPMDRLIAGMSSACNNLSDMGWQDASWGILTTDTKPKLVSQRLQIQGKTVTLTGMAKGSGMIKPDMATMLAFIATDAVLEQSLLQQCLQQAVADSFNAITVDGDTSTNDACMLLATGQVGVNVAASSSELEAFQTALNAVCVELAQGLIRDGEGATKFITVTVEKGRDRDECRQMAYAIAHSPLVKTAFYASDPNWGRILAVVGRAGLTDLDLQQVDIFLGDVCIVRAGECAADYTEERGQQVMNQTDIEIRIVLGGRGDVSAQVWTTDLSVDYVRINADYRS